MVTLADLRARSTVPSWQQAVAIIQELFLVTVANRGSAVRLPDIAHIGLNADGTVALLPHSSIPENPVRHLAVLLCLMLEKVPAPAPLLDLAERNLKDPPEFAVPEEFTRSLRYFERPGRDGDIKELVTRAERAREQKPVEDELRHLEERAQQLLDAKEIPERHVLERDGTVTIVKREPALGRGPRLPATSTTEMPGTEEPPPRRPWDVHGTVRLIILVTTLALVGYWMTQQSPSGAPTSLEEKVAKAAKQVLGDGTAAGPGVSGSSADRPPASTPLASSGPSAASSGTSSGSSASGSGRSAASTGASAPSASGPGPSSEGPAGGTPPASAPGAPGVAGGPVPALPPAADPGQAGNATFSVSDADVTPPVLLGREQPGAAPGAPAATYQLVVDASGNVEQVQLIAGDRGMRESMMRAHVKSWKFRPATRRGGPVRYRLQVRVAI